MAKMMNKGVRIAGITAAIPDNHTTIYELGGKYFDREFLDTMHKTVEVENIYICRPDQSSGDLGYAAADRLLDDLGWDRESVDGLMFVSQTLDYVIPPTSTELQNRLGLSNDVFVMDTNYGCAGFANGLMIASQFIQTGMCKRILLITAECHRRFIADEDRDNSLLIGDGAAAIAVESSETDSKAYFLTHVDGEHTEDITLGMYKKVAKVNKFGKQYSYMNGEAVTQYMLRNIPKVVKSLLAYSEHEKEDIDSFLFHQANAHMVKYVSKRMKLDLQHVPTNIENYANTSSVSIPLLICDKKKNLFKPDAKELVLMAGFGAGFLLAGVVIELGNLKGGEIIFV